MGKITAVQLAKNSSMLVPQDVN